MSGMYRWRFERNKSHFSGMEKEEGRRKVKDAQFVKRKVQGERNTRNGGESRSMPGRNAFTAVKNKDRRPAEKNREESYKNGSGTRGSGAELHYEGT